MLMFKQASHSHLLSDLSTSTPDTKSGSGWKYRTGVLKRGTSIKGMNENILEGLKEQNGDGKELQEWRGRRGDP